MDAVLRPLGIESPPVLTYLDKGLGASILRAGVRLWDSGALSPAAAIKITRHNLLRPTSLIHETFHQVAHLTGFNAELAEALQTTLLPFSPVAAAAWQQWAREVAADVGAFALLGYAPVPSLANVVDGTTPQVFAMPPRDPHPFAWLRVMFNAALCSELVRRRSMGHAARGLVEPAQPGARPAGRPPGGRGEPAASALDRRRVHAQADARLRRPVARSAVRSAPG